MLFGLLPLLVLAGIIALIVKAVRPSGASGPRESGAVSMRRFFQYVTLFGVLVVVAIGFTGLIEQLLPGGRTVVRGTSSAAARSLAFVIVGVPAYIGLGLWVNRQLDDPRERSSFGWSFYLTLSAITGLIVAAYAGFDLLTWAFGVRDFNDTSLAAGIVWGVIWLSHWFIIARYLDAPRGEGHLIFGSLVSLGGLASALGLGINALLADLYTALFETGVATAFNDDLALAGAGLIVAGGAWWIYWLRNASKLTRTPMWHVYVLLFGVLSGLSAAIGAGTTLLYLILEWTFGEPSATLGARQFDVTPALMATALVGLASFFYHRLVLAEDGLRARHEIRRVYEYTIAGMGLLGFAGGVATLLVALIQQLVPATDILGGESQINIVLGAVTFLIVGGPLWFGFWRRVQRIRVAEADSELRSPTRRLYLAFLFGVGGVAALISLVTAAFRFIEDLLDGTFGGSTIAAIAPAIAVLITTSAIAGYHWVVFKEDRTETPQAIRSRLREVVLIGFGPDTDAGAIAHHLDVRVRNWERTDIDPAQLDLAALLTELESESHERVMVVARPGGHDVVPFTEGR